MSSSFIIPLKLYKNEYSYYNVIAILYNPQSPYWAYERRVKRKYLLADNSNL